MEKVRLTPAGVKRFRRKVYGHFGRSGRNLPWRTTRDPYRILVSEVMLQQTQVPRVVLKYREFVRAFPGFRALAAAPLKEVVRVWQGMGYNRRALYLRKAAQGVVRRYGGKLPRAVEELETLPGIGPATARSIAAFAFNAPVPFIETNVRTVFIHEFFGDRKAVRDADVLPLVGQTLDRKDPWKWYSALMDYGTMLKERHVNPGRRSAHYKKQLPFLTSDRRIRGFLLRCISRTGAANERALCRAGTFPAPRVRRCLAALVKDGLLEKRKGNYAIP